MNVIQSQNPTIISDTPAPDKPKDAINKIGIPSNILNSNNPSSRSSVKGVPASLLSKLSTPHKPSNINGITDPVHNGHNINEVPIVNNINQVQESKNNIHHVRQENHKVHEVKTIEPIGRKLLVPQKLKSPEDHTPLIVNGIELSRDDIPKISTSGLTASLGILGRVKNPRYSPIKVNPISFALDDSKVSSPLMIKGESPHFSIPGSSRDLSISPNPIPKNLTFEPLDLDLKQIEISKSPETPKTDLSELEIVTPEILSDTDTDIPDHTNNHIKPNNNNHINISENHTTIEDVPETPIRRKSIPKNNNIIPEDIPEPRVRKKSIPNPVSPQKPKTQDTRNIEKLSLHNNLTPNDTEDEKDGKDEKKDEVKTMIENKLSIPKYSEMSNEERIQQRINFEVNFSKLARLYPHLGIQAPGPLEPLEHLYVKQLKYIKLIYNDQTTQGFREYIILFWACLELFVVKVLGLNASGYTMSQIMRMNQYDVVLQELGEKYSGDVASSLPPELRLLWYTLIHTFTFVFFNYLSVWIGPQISGMIRNFIDNISTGRNVQPVQDQNGNIVMPQAVAREGAGNVQGIPVGPVVQGLSSMMVNNQQQRNNNPPQNPQAPPVPKKPRPKFKEV
jgi:hypothetical protein